jgi:hypothetical protein
MLFKEVRPDCVTVWLNNHEQRAPEGASERSGYFRKVTGAQAPYHPDGGDFALVFPGKSPQLHCDFSGQTEPHLEMGQVTYEITGNCGNHTSSTQQFV